MQKKIVKLLFSFVKNKKLERIPENPLSLSYKKGRLSLFPFTNKENPTTPPQV